MDKFTKELKECAAGLHDGMGGHADYCAELMERAALMISKLQDDYTAQSLALKAAKAMQQAEPVAWQYRAKLADGRACGTWHGCSKRVYDLYKSREFDGDLRFEARELFPRPPAVAVADDWHRVIYEVVSNIGEQCEAIREKQTVDYINAQLNRPCAMLSATNHATIKPLSTKE